MKDEYYDIKSLELINLSQIRLNSFRKKCYTPNLPSFFFNSKKKSLNYLFNTFVENVKIDEQVCRIFSKGKKMSIGSSAFEPKCI